MPRTNFYVYALFRENGIPFYIGKGHKNRWLHHEKPWALRQKGHRSSIIRGMLARGVEVPKIKLHEGLTHMTAGAYEKALIQAIGRHPHGPLVNLTDGGEGAAGRELSFEARKRISAANKGRKHTTEAREKMRGRKRTPEQTAKLMAANIGRKKSPQELEKLRSRVFTATWRAKLRGPKSPEHRANIAAAKLGTKHSPETIAKLTGRVFSPEHRANISASKRR